MFSTFTPFFSQTIKKQLTNTLNRQLTTAVHQMDRYITLIKTTYLQTPHHPPAADGRAVTQGQEESFAGKFLTAAGLIGKRKTTAKKKGKTPVYGNGEGVTGQRYAVDSGVTVPFDVGTYGDGQGDGVEAQDGGWGNMEGDQQGSSAPAR